MVRISVSQEFISLSPEFNDSILFSNQGPTNKKNNVLD
jgi:hypothetical protein